MRDAPARQQTLRATIGWSVQLLDRSERDVLTAFAVFAGGATLDATETIIGAGLDNASAKKRRPQTSGLRTDL